jgi:hypothetical protein
VRVRRVGEKKGKKERVKERER